MSVTQRHYIVVCRDVRPDYDALTVVLLGMSLLGHLFFKTDF
jgi:hypothetical protein